MSISVTPLEQINSFKIEIPNFLGRSEMIGQYFETPKFCVKDLRRKSIGYCALRIYPKGEHRRNKEVQILIVNKGSNLLFLSVACNLLNKDGVRFKVMKDLKAPERPNSWCYQSRGSDQSLRTSCLKKHAKNMLPNGNMILMVELKLNTPCPHTVEAFSQEINLVCRGKKIPCRKDVLARWSPVFRDLFKENNSKEIPIDSLEPHILQGMVTFIYRGETKVMKCHAKELLIAADQFQLENLTEMCGYQLSAELDEDNIFDYLQLADKYCLENLKKHVTDFLAKKMKTLRWMEIRLEEIRSVYPDLVSKVLQMDE